MKVRGDSWLSSSQQLGPIGPPPIEAQHLMVCDPFYPNSTSWDVGKLRNLLPQYESLVRKIVPSTQRMKDEQVWLLGKTGQYTTKTGYASAKLNTEGKQKEFNWRKNIWNVKCSPKIRQFLWKMTHNALAVGESLLKRGMLVDGRCKRCGESESVLHVMFHCPFAKKVWDSCPAMFLPTESSVSSVEGLLKDATRIVNLPPVGLAVPLYPWICWVLWTSRNQLCFEDKSSSESEVLAKAIKTAREWQNANISSSTPSDSPKDCQRIEARDQLSATPQLNNNIFSCYSDAAWNSSTCAAGLGWICLKPDGSTLLQGSTSSEVVASVLMAEALALKAAMEATIAHEVKDLVCFSDSKSLITLITGNKSVVALRGILHDICVLSLSLNSISFKFVNQSCNMAADQLAKEALFSHQNSVSEM